MLGVAFADFWGSMIELTKIFTETITTFFFNLKSNFLHKAKKTPR